MPQSAPALSAWAEALHLSLTGIEFIPLKGRSNSPRALETWIGITRNVIPLYLILDQDGSSDAAKLVRAKVIASNQVHVWKMGSIEHYYPKNLLEQALSSLDKKHNLSLSIPEITKAISDGNLEPDKIDLGEKEKLLGRSKEVALAEEMAELIKSGSEVPDEIEDVLIAATSTSY